jgi:U6 snRNA-associated Sm-like protein LSm8
VLVQLDAETNISSPENYSVPLIPLRSRLGLPSARLTAKLLLIAMSLQTYIDSASSPCIHFNGHSLTPNCAEKVLVITVDGRTLVGTLLSCDQVTNIVLNDTVERIIRPADDPEPSSQVSHGLYLVRGDNITIIGLVDEELDNSIDWDKVRGEVIGTTKHV